MKNKNKINTNKGFSLIEIIVAVAILAIIVLPLLNAFVTSSKLNARSKTKLQAIETAKNIMEEMKGRNLADILRLANPDISTDSVFGNSAFDELEFDSSTNKYVVAANKTLRSNPATGKYDFYPKQSGRYYFFLKDITKGNYSANALITVSKSAISLDNLSKITPINTDRDILIDSTITKEEVVDKMKNDASLPDAVRKTVSTSNLRREIKIDIEAGSISAVSTYFNYYINGVTGPIDNVSDLKTDTSDSTKDELRSIYIFLEPWANAAGDDKIVINNPSNKKVNVYIVKQNAAGLATGRVNLQVKDGSLNFTVKSPTKIFTNISAANLSYRYYRDGMPLSPSTIDVQTTLVDSKSTDEVNSLARLYDIEVKVFKKDVDVNNIESAEPLVTLTGGMSN